MSRATSGKPFITRGSSMQGGGTPVTNGGLVWNGSSWVSQLANDDNLQICEWQPQDNGFKFWTGDFADRATNGQTLTPGTIMATKVKTPTAKSITTVGYVVGTAGATLTTGQCLIAVIDPTGAQLGSTSADQKTNFGGTSYKTATVGSFVTTAGSFLYVLFLANGTTGPVLQAKDANFANALNPNLVAGTYRGCSLGTGQTAFSFPYDIAGTAVSTKYTLNVGLL